MLTPEVCRQFGIAFGMEALEQDTTHNAKLEYEMDCVYVEESSHYAYLMREIARQENHPKDDDGTALENSPLYRNLRWGMYEGVRLAIDAHRHRGTYPADLLPPIVVQKFNDGDRVRHLNWCGTVCESDIIGFAVRYDHGESVNYSSVMPPPTMEKVK